MSSTNSPTGYKDSFGNPLYVGDMVIRPRIKDLSWRERVVEEEGEFWLRCATHRAGRQAIENALKFDIIKREGGV